MSEQIFRGACPGCEKFEIITLDGRGEGPAMEERGWALDSEGKVRCPGCPKMRVEEPSESDEEERLARVTYDGQSVGAARDRWRRLHLCLTCLHGDVCRFAPGVDGEKLLVTISRCRMYVPPLQGT